MTSADDEDHTAMYRSGWFRFPGSERRPLRLGYEAQLDGRAVIGRLSRDLPPVAATCWSSRPWFMLLTG
jgi:hypothetical protein